MSRYTQGKDGKFTGSIGSGKKNVPTPANIYPDPFGPNPTPPLASAYDHLYNSFRTNAEGVIPRLTEEEFAAWKEDNQWNAETGRWEPIHRKVIDVQFTDTPLFSHECGYRSSNRFTVEVINDSGVCPHCHGEPGPQNFVTNLYTDAHVDGVCDCGMCGAGCVNDAAPGSRLCPGCVHHGAYRGVDVSVNAPAYDPDVCISDTDPEACPEFCPCAECRRVTDLMGGY